LAAGAKGHYAADRRAGAAVKAHRPQVVAGARANRAFLARAVRYLAAECRIRQFLDIGTGLPAPAATHEVAQNIAPDSAITYVDNDPLVLVYARAPLTSTPQGRCEYIGADLRDAPAIVGRPLTPWTSPSPSPCCCWPSCISCPTPTIRRPVSPCWHGHWPRAASW